MYLEILGHVPFHNMKTWKWTCTWLPCTSKIINSPVLATSTTSLHCTSGINLSMVFIMRHFKLTSSLRPHRQRQWRMTSNMLMRLNLLIYKTHLKWWQPESHNTRHNSNHLSKQHLELFVAVHLTAKEIAQSNVLLGENIVQNGNTLNHFAKAWDRKTYESAEALLAHLSYQKRGLYALTHIHIQDHWNRHQTHCTYTEELTTG